jgi:hypothetical protein
MRETILLRIADHGSPNGIPEFALEVTLVGRHDSVHVGASQLELGVGLLDSFAQICTELGIPERRLVTTVEPIPTPILVQPNGFVAQATAKFAAQVIRGGKVVED